MLGPDHFTVAVGCALGAEHVLGTDEAVTEALGGLPVPLGAMHLTPTLTVQHAVVVALAMVVTLLLGVVVTGLSALAPDLDSPGTTLGKLLPAWWHRLTPGHRGPTHSLLFLAGWTGLGSLFGYVTNLPVLPELAFVGYASHLAMDAVTDHGVPLFWLPPPLVAVLTWPMPRSLARAVYAFVHWHVHTPITFTTGHWFEKWVATPAFTLLALYLGGVFDPVIRLLPPHL
jgi:membrane-bound metal-dependent hydrolase YbcI (DUF457 family)